MSITEVPQEVTFPISHIPGDCEFQVNVTKVLTPEEAQKVTVTLKARHDVDKQKTKLSDSRPGLFIHVKYLVGGLTPHKREKLEEKLRNKICDAVNHKVAMRSKMFQQDEEEEIPQHTA